MIDSTVAASWSGDGYCRYHAGCVGFDPTVSWGSWLCPRCVKRTALQQSPATPFRAATSIPLTTVVTSFSPGPVPVAELAYSAPVVSESDPSLAISVADEGESAVVLSMHNLPELSKVASHPEVASLQSSVDQAPVTGKVEEITIASVGNKVHFHISLQLLIVCPFFVAI